MVTQISQQDLRGVFAPLFAELNVEVRVEIAASSGWLEGEEAEIKTSPKSELWGKHGKMWEKSWF